MENNQLEPNPPTPGQVVQPDNAPASVTMTTVEYDELRRKASAADAKLKPEDFVVMGPEELKQADHKRNFIAFIFVILLIPCFFIPSLWFFSWPLIFFAGRAVRNIFSDAGKPVKKLTAKSAAFGFIAAIGITCVAICISVVAFLIIVVAIPTSQGQKGS